MDFNPVKNNRRTGLQSFASPNGNPADHLGIDNEQLQLIFPVKNFFLVGSPLGMFAAVYFEEPMIRSKLPTCDDFFNLFHPSDLVSFRLEPLIKEYTYPDHHSRESKNRVGSFMEVGRQESHADINSDNMNYLFGDQIVGPVLVPWYKNHGLCRS